MHADNATTSRLPSERSSITLECWEALEHLRNALDLAPPRSSDAAALVAIMVRLAAYAETALRSQSNHLSR
jgi:hypothetical protein